MGDESAIPVATPRRRNVNEEPVPVQESDLSTAWENFMKIHTQAYAATKEGQIFDEEGFKDKAFNSYQKALELIDKAIQISYGGGFSTEQVNKVDEIVYKIRMTRKEILERVSDLQTRSGEQSPQSPQSYLQGPGMSSNGFPSASPALPPQPTTNPNTPIPSTSTAVPGTSGTNLNIRQPPAYTPGNYSGQSSLSGSDSNPNSFCVLQGASSIPQNSQSLYRDLASALDEIAASQNVMPNPLPINAQEVFFIEKEVQLYFIAADGNVSAPSYPSFLRIVVINKDYEPVDPRQPPAFIQCGEWTYPLVKNASPLFKSHDGTYLFPDLSSADSGASIGLILPFECTDERRAQFEDTLLQLVGLSSFPGPEPEVEEEGERGEVPPTAPPRKLSTKIAEGLISGAECISKGLQYGAEKTSKYLDKGTSYLITKIDPVKQQPCISEDVKSKFKTAKTVSGKACEVSGYLVTQISRGTLMLGQYLAPHIQKGATQMYASVVKTDEEKASKKVNQGLEVCGAAVCGLGVVYNGLETAAKVLASSLANNTVQVVNHRYGTEAALIAEDTAETVGNSIQTGLNAKILTPKAVIKKAAKDAGKATLVTKGTNPPPPRPPAPSTAATSPPLPLSPK